MYSITNTENICIAFQARNYRYCPCPKCGAAAARHSIGKRYVQEIAFDKPTVIKVIYSKHYCKSCKKIFNAPMQDISENSCSYTTRVRNVVLSCILSENRKVQTVRQLMQQKYFVTISSATIYRWLNEHLIGST
jgi:hypothetical protein